MLYLEDFRIVVRNTIWLQTRLTTVVRMCERVGLQKKIGNTKEMVCTLVFTWGKQVVAACKQREILEGDTFI